MVETRTVIVRRGHFATFELLTRTFADDPLVQIIWDRRIAERRQPNGQPVNEEQRRGDRRAKPPVQWSQLNYMIARQSDG